jgi:hypothetical protein
MKKGSFKKERVKIEDLNMCKATLHMFDFSYDINDYGCGPNQLALLSGIHPSIIKEKNDRYNAQRKIRIGTTKKFIKKFLEKHTNYQVYELTIRDLCPMENRIVSKLNGSHLILAAQHVAKKERTWVTYWGGYRHHGVHDIKLMSLFGLMNHPLDSLFLLFDPANKFKSIKETPVKTFDYDYDYDYDRSKAKALK